MKKIELFSISFLLLLVFVAVLGPPAGAQFDSPLPPGENPPPPPSEGETLKLVLLWVLGGSGAGALAYWLLGHVRWLDELTPEKKRYAALLLSAGLACLAFIAAVGMKYKPDPGSGQAWLEQLFAVAYLAVTINQALHGRLQLRSK